MPRVPRTTYSMHGGAGAVISVGLLQKIPLNWMEGCIQSLTSTGTLMTVSRQVDDSCCTVVVPHIAGGDAFISICLWRAGYAFTDPGPGFFDPKIQMFDPGPEDTLGAMVWLAHALLDKCNALCTVRRSCRLCRVSTHNTQRQLDSMVSLHIRSRTFGPIQDAAHFMRALMAMYDEYRQKRHEHKANPRLALNHTELVQKMHDNNLANFHKLVVMGLLIPEYDDGKYE